MASPPPNRPWILWIALPAFVAIAAFELAAPSINGKSPDWVVFGLSAAGAFWIAVIRPFLARPARKD
jgi:mannose/fructose/N-acetylgalactosamine-specific phosphotransferase system component IIC